MLLRRFAYPCRQSDMIHRFGHSAVPEISMITSRFEEWIYTNHHSKVTQWNNQLLGRDKLEVYADAVAPKGAVLSKCFGFVDGTVRPICRPGQNQRIVYNGHKRVHALKFHSVTIPNGLVAHLCGRVGMFVFYNNLIDIFFLPVSRNVDKKKKIIKHENVMLFILRLLYI